MTSRVLTILVSLKIFILVIVIAYGFGFRYGEVFTFAKSEEYQPAETSEVKKQTILEKLLYLPQISPQDLSDSERVELLQVLERKKEQVEQRLASLREREEFIASIEQKVEARVRNLEEQNRFYQDTLQQEKKLQGERLDRLISFYQKMDPKKAAILFESLDRDMAVALFQRLPEKLVTDILALMEPSKAVALSEYFARIKSGKEFEILKELNESLVDEFKNCLDQR